MTAEEKQPLLRSLSQIGEFVGAGLVGRKVSRFFARIFPDYGENASLDAAWSYFETIALPRRMPDGKGGFTKAPPGTDPKLSTLYPAWTTPQRELRDFGTGIAVYFETLRALVVICLVAGLLYTPTFLYYRSDAYATSQENIPNPILRGSLICPMTQWVPCPNCTDWEEDSRIAHADGGLTFILKNACAPLRWQEGVNHLVVLVFLIVAIVALGFRQKKLELSYDEDLLTASDYSIVVKNPPPDATDPEEWKDFFSQFGNNEVVYCTVALDNDPLVKALTKRRVRLQKASFQLSEMNTKMPLQEIPASLAETNKTLHKKLEESEEKCRSLLKKSFPASAIFVTFDTEQCQRTVLGLLSVGQVAIATNDSTGMPPEHLFRGNLVLDVEEAREPSVIRWKDLNVSKTIKVFQQLCTGLLTVALIVLGFVAVKRAFQFHVNAAAFLIAILNILVPNIFKQINRLESHAYEGTYQASLYAKITIFRWVNTAIVTTLIKPFTATISDQATSLIPAVYAVLKAEIVTAPIVQMCDFAGNFKRYVLAPKAANQAAMNSFFRGSNQNLGEKYTNMTKVIFLCFFYAVIFPSSFFFGALAISATYMTDKFLLLRSWGPLPKLGDDVAKLSRRVFFPATLMTLALLSEFYWSAYPFDNACEADMVVSSESHAEYIGQHVITTASSSSPESFNVSLSGDGTEKIYRYCDQDYLERITALLSFFHEDKDDWMSPDQMVLTFLFGLFCVAVLVILGIVALVFDIWKDVKGVVGGNYSTIERDSGERYSHQERIKAYIPCVHHPHFSHPLLACDMSQIDSRHIGWTDTIYGHSYYDMSNDVEFLLYGEKSAGPTLSVVGHYPKS